MRGGRTLTNPAPSPNPNPNPTPTPNPNPDQVLGGLGTFFQTLSLSQIPALTAAVLYSTVNVITPALAAVAGANPTERSVSARTWAGCLLGLIASCWSLIPDSVLLPTELPTSMGQGEAVMLAASCCYAATKVRLSSHLLP